MKMISYLLFLLSLLAFNGCASEIGLNQNSPQHHTENGYRNFPIIEPADTQTLKLIWNRMLASGKSHEIPEAHLLDEDKALAQFARLSEKDTVTWIGQSTTLLKLDGKIILTDPFFFGWRRSWAICGTKDSASCNFGREPATGQSDCCLPQSLRPS